MTEQPPHRAADDVFDPAGIEWTPVSPALAKVRRTILLSVLTVVTFALVRVLCSVFSVVVFATGVAPVP